jgi:hypothetical protein
MAVSQQRTTQSIDPGMMGMRGEVFNAARRAAAAGPGAGITDASNAYRTAAGGVQAGMDILQGDASRFFNPYQQEVIDRVQGDFGRLSDAATASVNANAARMGAFGMGGSRLALAQGRAAGDIARESGNTIAGLRQQGWRDAVGQQLSLGGLLTQTGLAGAGGSAELQRMIDTYGPDILQRAMLGAPMETTSTTTMRDDPWKTALGLGLAGAGMFFGGPAGAAAAGGMAGGMGGGLFAGPRPATPSPFLGVGNQTSPGYFSGLGIGNRTPPGYRSGFGIGQ